ncbi:MAG: ATP-binding protein [Bacteroidales bacterium]|jgi:anti-sigma regulatory factor (Ser/Thr protein kinase)|nr:ATP-binding protein [Bacteroidales bacterium]
MEYNFTIEKGNFTGAGKASSDVKKILKQLDINPSIIKRVVVALFEAEINVVAHAESGNVYVTINDEKISMIVEDIGPGIKDIEMAMKEGYSTASQKVREMGFGAGMGLPNIKKNTDDFTITSELNKGTHLEMSVFIR